ncbi:GNAT family N-acetyltransferase [Photobacterium sp. 53610]|uniref:GNAT family N-acetyltransferase n=1 Tax=Photobacterium sp. 53610 TaxID=3102789 RepID=UPI002ED9B830
MSVADYFEGCEFHTARLRVSHISKLLNQNRTTLEELLAHAALNLLTPKVTHSLPPEFQSVQCEHSARVWARKMMKESHVLVIQVTVTQEIIGFIFLSQYDDAGLQKAHVGYLLGEGYWGQGYASECLAGLIAWCQEAQIVSALVAGVETENFQSVRLLQKHGFDEVAIDAPAGVLFFERVLTS